MENGIIRAVIYARVSTKEQVEGKISIPNQIERSRKTVIDHGWKLAKEPYVDSGVSGHLLEERCGLQDLLRDAREHIFDLVVVTNFDRFARNRAAATIVREELKELFIQTYALETPVEPKEPKKYDPTDDDLAIMVEGFSDAQSEIERNKIRRRMTMGKIAVAKSGKIPNKIPYGYKLLRSLDSKGKIVRTIVEDYEASKVIKEIYSEFIKGKGRMTIAFGLNQKGIKSPRGGLWTAHTIQYILKNETYTGKVMWGWRHADYKKSADRKRRGHAGIAVPGNHPVIITEEIFNLAKREREIRGTSQKGRATISRGLLTGIAKCIRCGSGVSYVTRKHKRSHKNTNWHDTVTHEYLCGGHKYSGICQRRVMSAEKLEGFVINQIRNLINNPIAKERLIFDRGIRVKDEFQDEYETAKKHLNEIPNKMRKQQEAYETGLITLEEYGIAMSRLREDENQYRTVTGESEIRLAEVKRRQNDIEKFVQSLEDFDKLWEEANFEEKKHFLKTIISEVRAGNDKVEIDFRF